jgi:hypothetical protein
MVIDYTEQQPPTGAEQAAASADPELQDASYQPTEQDEKAVAEVDAKFERWLKQRKPYEIQWFINAAFYRGLQYIAYDNQYHTIRTTQPVDVPSTKKKVPINRIFPKIRARLAKFLRGRPQPTVIAASNEIHDRLNARASQLALDYAWRKLFLEIRYRDALLWAKDCGKGFWWFHWNEDAQGRMKISNPATGSTQVLTLPLGDVQIEVGSPFEVLVSDPSIAAIGDQPEIMRVKLRDIEDVRGRYPKVAHLIQATPGYEEAFQFERRIASLTAKTEGMTLTDSPGDRSGTDKEGRDTNKVLVKELFCRPSKKWPNGRYLVVVGSVLARNDELPWFSDMENPFPVEEFTDVSNVGQFWSTTITEQLIGPQRQYNFIRNKIDQQLRLMMHPKIFTPKQAMIAKNAFHSGAGEKIEYNWIPGLPAPFAWTPPNVAADAWRLIQTLKEEIEDISQIFPASEGSVGSAASGYQTNLLQEASDGVHAPDARAHELTIERSAWKIRRLMKLGYDVPRLLTVAGANRQAEVIEFHSEQIDENADIIVQTGSGLPTLKAAKQQILLDYYEKGIFGPPGTPDANRKFLSMADVGGLDTVTDPARNDEELAMMENDDIANGNDIPVPQFFEDHMQHYQVHTNLLKSVEAREWDDDKKLALISHVLLHFKFINPIAAANHALEYGLTNLIGFGPDKIPPPPQPAPMGAPGIPGQQAPPAAAQPPSPPGLVLGRGAPMVPRAGAEPPPIPQTPPHA